MARREPRRRGLFSATALVLPLLVGACSSPEWINPGTWFEDDPPQAETIIVPEDNSAIPNLASVPPLPPRPSPQIQRQAIAEGLQADRDNARYSDEPLTAQSTAVPAADPPLGNAAPPSTFDVATVPDETGVSSAPLAPPPPIGAPGAAPSATPGVGAGTAPGSAPQPAPPRVGAAAPPPTLLQHQAYQQLAQQQQQLQQLALQNQAFEQEARQRAIEQQFLRQQAIEQQAVQRRALELQARQLAGLPPAPQAPALQAAPQAFPQQAFPQQAFPQQAPVGGALYGAPAAGALAYGGAGFAQGQNVAQGAAAPNGNLIGVIYFQHGSSSLDGNDREVLRQVVSLARQSGAGLQVVGHASARTGALDPTRHRMANLRVSMSRANRVADALAGLGAPRERIAVSAQADSRPVYHEFMPTGEAGNRRVEIYLQF